MAQKRTRKWVTAEIVFTEANCQIFKDGELSQGILRESGVLAKEDIIGKKIDGGVICGCEEPITKSICYRMPVEKFMELAEEYERDRRNSGNKGGEKK